MSVFSYIRVLKRAWAALVNFDRFVQLVLNDAHVDLSWVKRQPYVSHAIDRYHRNHTFDWSVPPTEQSKNQLIPTVDNSNHFLAVL